MGLDALESTSPDEQVGVWLGLVWFGLVWFGWFGNKADLRSFGLDL